MKEKTVINILKRENINLNRRYKKAAKKEDLSMAGVLKSRIQAHDHAINLLVNKNNIK